MALNYRYTEICKNKVRYCEVLRRPLHHDMPYLGTFKGIISIKEEHLPMNCVCQEVSCEDNFS